ncbi:MAG: DUF4091 domain-containing protein [candidate division WOR-3 bacterium]|nr:DUF4091 domain-containing protein [candidate division WOR-3 bacterium]
MNSFFLFILLSLFNEFKVFTLNSLERLTDEKLVEKSTISPIELYFLRNEHEAFQIGIKNDEDCVIEFDFTKNLSPYLKIYYEYFVPIIRPSHSLGRSQPVRTEKIPDPLIPIEKSKEIKKGINIFWFDVYIPKDEEKEIIEGEVKIKISPQNLDYTIPIKLNILKENLIPSFKTLFVFWINPIIEKHRNCDRYLITRLYYEEALSHKITPSAIPLDIRPKRIEISKILNNDERQPPLPIYSADFNITYSTGRLEDNLEYYRGKNLKLIEVPLFAQQGLLFFQWQRYLEVFSDYFEKKGFSEIIDYSFDEPKPEHYDFIREWAYNLHKFTKIKNLVVFNNFYSQRVDERLLNDGSGRSSVDIWVPKFSLHYYFKDFFKERENKGEEVWAYQAGVTDSFTPKWLLDYPLIEKRVSFWLFSLFNIKGMVYWGIDKWQRDVYDDPTVIIDNKVYNGDGYLLYYGSKFGLDKPIPSIRLKVIRDGIEDYEYLKILKELDYSSYLNLINKIARNWNDWSNNNDSLILIKKEMWERIKNLIKEKKKSLNKQSIFFNEEKIIAQEIFDITGKRINEGIKKGIYFIKKNRKYFKIIKL